MESKWKAVQLQDVVSLLGDGLHGTPKYSDKGDYCFINGNNLKNGKIIFTSNTKTVDESQFIKYKKNLNDRTILVSINGTIGNVAFYNGEKVILGKSACYFNVLENVDKVFIRYIVSSPYFMHYLETFATGTTIKNVSLKSMREFTFKLPPLTEQKRIAHILGSLDDKIELNRQMNQTLEQMAQVLFKSWFVDFDPVIDNALSTGNPIPEELQTKAEKRKALGKERKDLPEDIQKLFPDEFEYSDELEKWVPRGWRVGSISDVSDVIGGGTPSTKVEEYYAENEIPWLSPKDLSGYEWKFISRGDKDISELGLQKSSAKLMPKGTVLFSSRAPIGYVAIAENEISTNQGFKSLVPKNGMVSDYLFYFLKQNLNEIEAIATGSTFKEVSGTAMKNFKILIPDSKLLAQFELKTIDFNQKRLINQKEVMSLTKLRDTLLPKLISGEVRVPEVEKMIE